MANRRQDEGASTREALLLAAERLMGERGLEGAALHVIAQEAGQANKYAVQYHFGDRAGIIEALLGYRLRGVDARREELMDHAAAEGRDGEVRALVVAMHLPLVELVGPSGRRDFARFLLQFLTQFSLWGDVRHPLFAPDAEAASKRLVDLFARALPQLDRETLVWRLNMQARVLLNTVVEHENRAERGADRPTLGWAVDQAFDMMAAALAAP